MAPVEVPTAAGHWTQRPAPPEDAEPITQAQAEQANQQAQSAQQTGWKLTLAHDSTSTATTPTPKPEPDKSWAATNWTQPPTEAPTPKDPMADADSTQEISTTTQQPTTRWSQPTGDDAAAASAGWGSTPTGRVDDSLLSGENVPTSDSSAAPWGSPVEVTPAQNSSDEQEGDSAQGGTAGAAQGDDGGWGTNAQEAGNGGWGTGDTQAAPDGWGATGAQQGSGDAGGSSASGSTAAGGWGTSPQETGTNGWGTPANQQPTTQDPAAAGWGASAQQETTGDGWGAAAQQESAADGWGASATQQGGAGGGDASGAQQGGAGGWGSSGSPQTSGDGWGATGVQTPDAGQWGSNAAPQPTTTQWGAAGAAGQQTSTQWGSTGQQTQQQTAGAWQNTDPSQWQGDGGPQGGGVRKKSKDTGDGGGGSKTPLIIGGAVALVILVVVAVLLIVNGGDKKTADPGTSPGPQPTGSAPTTPATSGAPGTKPGQSKDPKLHEGSRISSDAISFPRQGGGWSDRKRLIPQLLNSSGQYVLLQKDFDGSNDWYADMFVGGLGTATPFNGDPKATAAALLTQVHNMNYGNIPVTYKAVRNGAVKRSDKAGWYFQETVTAKSPKVTSVLLLTVAVFDLGDGTAVAYISDIPTNRPDLKTAESQVYKGINVG